MCSVLNLEGVEKLRARPSLYAIHDRGHHLAAIVESDMIGRRMHPPVGGKSRQQRPAWQRGRTAYHKHKPLFDRACKGKPLDRE